MQSIFHHQVNQDLLERLFRVFDRDNTGVLRWSVVVMNLATMCGGDVSAMLTVAFSLFDVDGNGVLSRGDFDEYISPLLTCGEDARQDLATVKNEAFEKADKLALPEFIRLFDASVSSSEAITRFSDLVRSLKRNVAKLVSSLQTSFTGARNQPVLVHGTHRYRFSIDLYSLKIQSLQVASIYMSYRYPLLGASTEVRTSPPVEAIRNTETILPDSFCAFEFSMNAATLFEDLSKNPLTVMVWHKDKLRKDISIGSIRIPLADVLGAKCQNGPNGTTIQVLDHRYGVIGTEGAGERKAGSARIMLSLENFGPVANNESGVKGQRALAHSREGKDGVQWSDADNRGQLSEQDYRAAWELEMWRAAEEAKWRAELKEKEHARMEALEKEWKRREAERESEVKQIKGEYGRLESKLKQSLLDIEKREPKLLLAEKEIEKERDAIRKEVEKHTVEKADEVRRIRDKFNHDLVLHKVKLQEAQNFNEALEHRLAESDSRYKKLDIEFQDYKRKSNNSSETQLHGQIAEMAKERLVLERQKDSIMLAKDQYKEQLVKALRELQELKKIRETERMERLHKDQQELDAMRMQYMAQEHGRNLHADRKELDGIKRELSGLALSAIAGPHYMMTGGQQVSPSGNLVDGLDEVTRGHRNSWKRERSQMSHLYNAPNQGNAMQAMQISKDSPLPTAAVSFPTSQGDSELTRLVQERDDLLRSGIYKNEDMIVQQLNSRIEQLAMGRDAAKWM